MDVGSYDFSGVGKRMVEYIWDPVPRNDAAPATTLWCLGRQYDPSPASAPPGEVSDPPSLSSLPDSATTSEASSSKSGDDGSTDSSWAPVLPAESWQDDGGWPSAFLDDFGSKVWLTYRSNFPPIPRSPDPKAVSTMSFAVRLRSQFGNPDGFTSDTGWGCMIRSGQSLLANSLVKSHLGRDWRRGQKAADERRLLGLFADDPRAPYSIHRFVEHGASACGKHPGEWFGPSATARCIQALTGQHPDSNLRVYSTGDAPDVYEDAFLRTARGDAGRFLPTLILIGIRLGIDRITPVYWDGLEAMLSVPQSVGIAGGRTRASHYFVGNQGNYFFYLDPHHTRPAVAWQEAEQNVTEEEAASFFTRRLRRINIREMDPSMLLGFLIMNEAEWKDWRKRIAELPGRPIIHISSSEPSMASPGVERESAIDEVEAFDDDDDLPS